MTKLALSILLVLVAFSFSYDGLSLDNSGGLLIAQNDDGHGSEKEKT